MFMSWAQASLMLFIKSVLSFGDIITDVLLKLISSLSSDAAGADNKVLVAFMDRMSSMKNFCENINPDFTINCLPSMIYLMPNSSDRIKADMAMSMHNMAIEKPAYIKGDMDMNIATNITNMSQLYTFALYVFAISCLFLFLIIW